MFGLIKTSDVDKFQPTNKIYQDRRRSLNSRVSKKAYLRKVVVKEKY